MRAQESQRTQRVLIRSGTHTLVNPPDASSVPKNFFIASACEPPVSSCRGSFALSHALMVIILDPTVMPTQPKKPFIDIISPTIGADCCSTTRVSSGERLSSTVMLYAPGLTFLPLKARVAFPNV